MERQKDDPSNLLIPKVLASLSEGIISLNGMNTEGIFRLAGSASEIQTLRKQLEKGEFNVATVPDVHVVGTVLKQFLRELPEAVIPTSFYEECTNGSTSPTEILGKLPTVHKNVLLYIINYLQVFIKPVFVKNNKMNSANLATIFATILLRSPQKDPTALLAGLTNEMGFIEKLIATAPALDDKLFPVLAGLHRARAPSATTSLSPNASPSIASSTSSLGDVAYSTAASTGATDASITSFEDMSSNKDASSDFSDHSELDGKGDDEEGGKDGQVPRLGSSEDLPEFVFVPNSASSQAPPDA